LVRKLRDKGQLTADEEERASAYLSLHERTWPDESDILDGAELYLDDLSVSYLSALGLLSKPHAAGFSAFIAQSEVDEANRLIALGSLVEQELETIEAIRATLSSGIRDAKVRVFGAGADDDEETEDQLRNHPTFTVLRASDRVDAIVIDDRCMNRHAQIAGGPGSNNVTPIVCTLDILDDLARRGAITLEGLFALRTHLRRAGYQIVPIREDELTHYLLQARVVDGKLVETAELRAIRESLLCARMKKVVQLPDEGPALSEMLSAVTGAIRMVWQRKESAGDAAPRATWLTSLLDLRGFSGSAVLGQERLFALHSQVSIAVRLVGISGELSRKLREPFKQWLDECLLRTMKATEPVAFDMVIGKVRHLIEHMSRPPDASETVVPT
jgi:hypothetical protein